MIKLLEPFGFTFGQLQDISTLLKHLEKNNVSIEAFIDYIEEQKKEKVKAEKQNKEQGKKDKAQWDKNALKCSECKTTMNLYPVNFTPRDQVGGDFNSQWLCPNCGYEEYSTKTIREWFDEIRR